MHKSNVSNVSAVVLFTLLAIASHDAFSLENYLDKETLEFSDSYDKRLRYTPSTVVILDHDYIRNSGALTVAELLERVVGIHMTRKPYGASSNQFIRGIDSNLLVLHNGVENAKIIPELLSMPVIDLERVEVVKGSHYPLYAASALVGTVNLVTSAVKKDSTDVGLQAGTLDTKQVWLRKSDSFSDLGYSAYLSHTRTQTTKGQIDVDVQTFIDLGAGTDVSLAPSNGFFSAEITDARLTLELGDRWTLHQFLNHREFGTGVGLGQSLDPEGEEVVTYYSADLRYENQIGRGDFEARVTYNYVDLSYNDLTILRPGTLGGLLPDGAIQRRYSKTGDDIFAEGLYRIVLGRNTLDLGVGGSYGHIDNESDIRNYTLLPGQSSPVPLGDFVELSTSTPLFGGDYDVSKAHLMVRDEYKVSNSVFLNAGGRIDYSSDIGAHLIPRIGINWIAGQYTNLSLLYGDSVQAPDVVTRTSQGQFYAQGNDELKPERVQLLEFTVDHRLSSTLFLVANLYMYNRRDAIAIVDDPNAPNGNSYINVSDNEDGTGAELIIDWNIKDKTKLTAGVAIVDVQSVDQSVERSPRFEPYLEINHKTDSGFNTNIAVIGVANRNRSPGDDRPSIDDYAVLNATVVKSDMFINDLDFSLSVQNMFAADAREDISVRIPFDLPVYPRRILAGLSYRYD